MVAVTLECKHMMYQKVSVTLKVPVVLLSEEET